MAWVYLIIAGCFEVGFTTSLKLSNNFTNKGWALLFFVSISLSFYFINKAIESIPMGSAYAVWTGIGAAGTALFLLGVGWNFLFTGSTTLSLAAYSPQERDRAQGALNFFVFATLAASSRRCQTAASWPSPCMRSRRWTPVPWTTRRASKGSSCSNRPTTAPRGS